MNFGENSKGFTACRNTAKKANSMKKTNRDGLGIFNNSELDDLDSNSR